MRGFQPHGSYRIERDGRILKVSIQDTANRELMEGYALEMRDFVSTFQDRPFATYTEYLSDALVIEESIESLISSLAERKARGLCAVAVNVNRVTSPSMMTAQIARIYDGLGLRWERFEDYLAAREWLLERLAEADTALGGT